MTCGSCRYYGPINGDCRRHSPVMVPMHGKTLYPATTRSGWCGDYSPAPVTVGPTTFKNGSDHNIQLLQRDGSYRTIAAGTTVTLGEHDAITKEIA